MLLIYCDKITPRVRYAVDLMIREVLCGTYTLTDDKARLETSEEAVLNYSNDKRLPGLRIAPARLLFENGIRDQEIKMGKQETIPTLFAGSSEGLLPFDVFAAGFYMVTRYEEYLPHRSDQHQRFSAADTLAFRKGFLKKPVVNIWAAQLKTALLRIYPHLSFGKRTYQFINTFDIDNAYAYKEKGLLRTIGGLARSLTEFDLKGFSERLQVNMGYKNDPYDTFDYLLGIHKKHRLKTICFFLLADYGKNDKNVPVTSRRFRSLIQYMADYTEVGIHPSYGSNSEPEKLKTEVERLAEITKREVTRSRQHFLRLSFPETYRRLADRGITDDYTMGFASETGFRAGICSSYHHYDLDSESLTKLRIHPFVAMDGTLNEYLNMKPDVALKELETLIAEIKAVQGTFISLWHNETINDMGKWKNWRTVYERTIEMGKET